MIGPGRRGRLLRGPKSGDNAVVIAGRRDPARGRARGGSLRLLLAALLALAGLLLPSDGAPAAEAAKDRCRTARSGGDFRTDGPLVATYLYYWYEPEDRDDPALALHPPAGAPFDWRDPDWYRRQMRDMAEAGVDVVLPVYWGEGPAWSTRGLTSLVQARESLLAEGVKAPALGLFVDFNLYSEILPDQPELGDLTTQAGLEALAKQMEGFFERVPACHRATVGGRPLVFLWRPDTEDGGRLQFDQGTFDGLYDRLTEQLGVRPYVVRERTWDAYAQEREVSVSTDAVFGWGAALHGPLFDAHMVAVGPGYDDRALAWREGYIRPRDDGRTYGHDLREAVSSGTPWLLLETWNEWWEATGIAETAEYGRTYLDLTRRYTDLLRQLGAERARDGWYDLGNSEGAYLERLADAPQEQGFSETVEGRSGARPLGEDDGTAYFHFALRPRLSGGGAEPLLVQVEYFDEGPGSFRLEYETRSPDDPEGGAYTPTPEVTIEGTRRWRWHLFALPDADFQRRQYGGYGDFRIRDRPEEGQPSHLFGRVLVSRASEVARPVPLGPGGLATLAPSGGPTELRWRGVEGAAGYLVEVDRVGTDDALRTWCDAGPGDWSAGEAPCGESRWEGPPEQRWPMSWSVAKPGLYRWRTRATDATGLPLGDASDWSFFQVGE